MDSHDYTITSYCAYSISVVRHSLWIIMDHYNNYIIIIHCKIFFFPLEVFFSVAVSSGVCVRTLQCMVYSIIVALIMINDHVGGKLKSISEFRSKQYRCGISFWELVRRRALSAVCIMIIKYSSIV